MEQNAYYGKRLQKVKLSSIFACYAILLSICYILPSLKYDLPYIPIAVALLGVYVITAIYDSRQRYYIEVVTLCSLGLSIMTFLVRHQFNFSETINEFVRSVRFFAPAMVFLYLIHKKNKKSIRNIFVCMTILLFGIMVNTAQALLTNPTISRLLATATDDAELIMYEKENIGGFGFCYAIGFAVIFCFDRFLKVKSIRNKIFCGIGFVFGFYFIIQTQYTTLLLLTVLGCILCLYTIAEKLYAKAVLLIVTILLVFSLSSIFAGLASQFSGSVLGEKFQWFVDFFDTGNISELHSRPQLYWEAFMRFLKSPLWGNAISSGGVVYYNDLSHSTVLSYLQSTGLLGFTCYLIPLVVTYRKISQELKKERVSISGYKIICVILFILSILNPIGYAFEISFVVYLYIPCGMILFQENKIMKRIIKEKENEGITG